MHGLTRSAKGFSASGRLRRSKKVNTEGLGYHILRVDFGSHKPATGQRSRHMIWASVIDRSWALKRKGIDAYTPPNEGPMEPVIIQAREKCQHPL